jgi:cardiolipin synthase
VTVPRWLPNAISVLRVLLVPVWLYVAELMVHGAVVEGSAPARIALGAILVGLGFSDVLDGYIARRFELTSRFGATLDAVADKLAQIAFVTYLVFRPSPAFEPLPLWFWATLVLRDGTLLVGFLLIRARHGTVDTEHEVHGKVASVLLFLVVLAAAGWGAAPLSLLFVTAAVVSFSTLRYVQLGHREYVRGAR